MSLGSSAQAETLREAVQAALGNHPSVEAAMAGKQSALEEEREEHSAFFSANPDQSVRRADFRGQQHDKGAGCQPGGSLFLSVGRLGLFNTADF